MTTKTYPIDKITLIDAVVRELESNHDSKWDENGEMLSTKLKNGGKIVITFPEDTNEGTFKVEYDAKGKKVFDEIERIQSQNITEEDVRNSIFSKIDISHIKNGDKFYLGKNITVFKELEKYFKRLKFKSVGAYMTHGEYLTDVVFEEPVILLTTYNHHTGINFDEIVKLKEVYKDIEGFKDFRIEGEEIPPVFDEKIEPVVLKGIQVGKYYKNRNLLALYINPFKSLDLRDAKSYKDNKYLATILDDLAKVIKGLKIKKVSTKTFQTKILVNQFEARTRNKVKELMKTQSDTRRKITEYEQSLTKFYTDSKQMGDEIAALSIVKKDSIKSFLERIAKLKTAPIVTNVELKEGRVNITFKPTTIKARVARNVEGDTEKGRLIEMFVGSITASISGDGSIIVSCDYPYGNFSHPHGNDNGQPCLGSGDGPSLIHELIGSRKFYDFAYVFWMWIKRWRTVDCYIPPYDYYDDRLKHGLPVFDQKGNRIKINDKELIKSGEQIELTKESDYEENLKKYEDFRPQS